MRRRELVTRLQAFRRSVERQARAPALEVQAPVGLVLFDLAVWLGLTEDERIAVLGADNALRLHEEYGIEFEI